MAGSDTPASLRDAFLVLPMSDRWIPYWGSVDMRPPQQLTEPDPDSSYLHDIALAVRVAKAAKTRFLDRGVVVAPKAEVDLLHRAGHQNFLRRYPDDALLEAVRAIHWLEEHFRVLWYEDNNPHFLNRLSKHDPTWWNSLRELAGHPQGIPTDPRRVSPPPHSPRTWVQFLRNAGLTVHLHNKSSPCVSGITGCRIPTLPPVSP